MDWRIFLFVAFTLPGQSLWGQEAPVELRVRDAETELPLACRVYLTDSDGQPYFFAAISPNGSAVSYQKKNWINSRSIEYHTTLSAHPGATRVPLGEYELVVERGKSYRMHRQTLHVGPEGLVVEVNLSRWTHPAARGWFSGDTHIHRSVKELHNIQLAEDLNVTFPLTNWVTYSDRLPATGDKSQREDLPDGLVRIDDTHVIWPRNTEYEIFTVGKNRHTLGALFVLGHHGGLEQTVPPWKDVVHSNRNATPRPLFDMDKLDWPFAMLLPTVCPDALYELSNNHVWRTEFAFRKWNTPAPGFIQPPFGRQEGGHRAWIDYTLGMYYTLLNCGFRMPPTAGTANGVHPVPAGFGRVYVHQPDGFQFDDWREGLRGGRSFVTTGPMLYATAAGHDPGHVFRRESSAASIPLEIEILSEHRVAFAEILLNGAPVELLRGQANEDALGAHRILLRRTVMPRRSGWFAVRVWEQRPDGRTRFAHTAPWYVDVGEEPVRPSQAEKDYLVQRMRDEIQRSRPVVSPEAVQEYQDALAFYEGLTVNDDEEEVRRTARPAVDAEEEARWLRNMVHHHRFTPDEVRRVLGGAIEDARRSVAEISPAEQAVQGPPTGLRVMPYPGGRHPRRGFLEGAVRPQRDTKISIFAPWENGGYVVVDVPEAVFSNLGLTYLAHEHIPTIWDQQDTKLPRVEWQPSEEGFRSLRELPNGIVLDSRVRPREDEVEMEISLTNGTSQRLTKLRVQVCTMLKGALGFETQETLTQVVDGSYLAVRARDAERWIVTCWNPNHRTWDNPPVPCIHSDPVFPDCEAGQTVQVKGRLFFYQGQDVRGEIARRKTRQSQPEGLGK